MMLFSSLFVRFMDYRLSVVLTVVIFAVCLYDLPEIPLENVCFIDKYSHILMYLIYGVGLWSETGLHSLSQPKRWSICVAWPLVMGVLIEILQSLCTQSRHGDLLDVAANSLGVALAVFVGRVISKHLSKHSIQPH